MHRSASSQLLCRLLSTQLGFCHGTQCSFPPPFLHRPTQNGRQHVQSLWRRTICFPVPLLQWQSCSGHVFQGKRITIDSALTGSLIIFVNTGFGTRRVGRARTQLRPGPGGDDDAKSAARSVLDRRYKMWQSPYDRNDVQSTLGTFVPRLVRLRCSRRLL